MRELKYEMDVGIFFLAYLGLSFLEFEGSLYHLFIPEVVQLHSDISNEMGESFINVAVDIVRFHFHPIPGEDFKEELSTLRVVFAPIRGKEVSCFLNECISLDLGWVRFFLDKGSYFADWYTDKVQLQ